MLTDRPPEYSGEDLQRLNPPPRAGHHGRPHAYVPIRISTAQQPSQHVQIRDADIGAEVRHPRPDMREDLVDPIDHVLPR